MTAVEEPTVANPLIRPITIGKAWQTDENGEYVFPKYTLGWQILGWCAKWLQTPEGDPWVFTNEQARFVLWLYEINEAGKFTHTKAVYQRMKGAGKAEVLSAKLPTPTGWTTVGDIKVGDELFGADGQVIKCIQTHPVLEDHPSYRVELSDGTSSVFSGEHLFAVDVFEGKSKRVRKTLSVEEMVTEGLVFPRALTQGTTKCNTAGVSRFALPAQPSLDLPEKDLLIDPYLLGTWLGDGDSDGPRITVGSQDLTHLLYQIDALGVERGDPTPTNTAWRVRFGRGWAKSELRNIGVLGNKHIPTNYLRSSHEQRLSLLQGLMDTDGSIALNGSAEFSVTNQRLAKDTAELIRSLGMTVRVREGDATLNGRVIGKRYRLCFKPYADTPVFRLPRKVERLKIRTYSSSPRVIKSIQRVDPEPMRCITVSAEDGLYLTGESMWTTHNSPFAAVLAMVEFVGPCRFSGWNESSEPVAMPNPVGWVQIAAVSISQTKNTMMVLSNISTKRLIDEYGIDPGKEVWYADHGSKRIEVITSSYRSAEGARPTLIIMDETHHMVQSNGGHELNRVITRNARKAKNGATRVLATTNAYNPAEDSVAQRTRESYEAIMSGETVDIGLLYDSLEAPTDVELSQENLPALVRSVRGDSTWLDIDSVIAGILDKEIPLSDSRRFWLNQITATEESWADPLDLDLCETGESLQPGDNITMFLDCSLSDDATALMGCRVDDGLVQVLGLWQNPGGDLGKTWTVPRGAVDERVDDCHAIYNVKAFFGDPSHVKEAESGERYWDSLFDRWHQKYKDTLTVWAISGTHGHAITFDMSGPRRFEQFVAATERTLSEIEETASDVRALRDKKKQFLFNSDARFKAHARNARRYPTKFGIAVAKDGPESQKKIDLLTAAIGARMCRRLVLNLYKEEKPTSGRVWGYR